MAQMRNKVLAKKLCSCIKKVRKTVKTSVARLKLRKVKSVKEGMQ